MAQAELADAADGKQLFEEVRAVINLGLAKLEVANKNASSIVVEQFSQAPLQLHMPLYLENASYPTVYLKTPSSGLLGGDEHHIDVVVGKDSELELRTQAATLVYPGKSSLTINIKIEAGGKLTFLPDQLILGASACLKQRVKIEMWENSIIEYSDTWCAGRIAMQELWMFEKYDYSLEILRNGKMFYRENWVLEPAVTGITHPLVCGDYTHFSSRYSFGSQANSERMDQTNSLREWETNQTWSMERDGNLITKRSAKVFL